MTPNFVQVFASVEPALLLHVISAVIVVEEQVVVGTGCCQRLRVVVWRAPNLSDNILSERILEHLDQVVVVDHVERVPAVQVFLKQEESHLFFSRHVAHVLESDLKDLALGLLHTPLHEGEPALNFIEQLYDQACGFDHIQAANEKITTTLVVSALFDSFKEFSSLLEAHKVDETFEQEALGFKLSISFAE